MRVNTLNSNFKKTIEGPLVLTPKIFKDSRGYFSETWNQSTFNTILKADVKFVQDNESTSSFGVLRGLHYQLDPKAQGKLVRVSKGIVYDVIVDLRKSSNTFGQWAGIIISENNHYQLWIPRGFAHGFLTISKEAILQYKVTNFWSKEEERSLIWNDNHINIVWDQKKYNLKEPILSQKDSKAPSFNELSFSGDLFE